MTTFINIRQQLQALRANKNTQKYFKTHQDIDIYIMTNDANDTLLANLSLSAIDCMMTSNKRDTLSELTAEQVKELMAIFYIDTYFYPPSKDIYSDLLRLNGAEVKQAIDEFIDITDLSLIITKNTPPKTNISTEHNSVISTAHIMDCLDYTENNYTEKQLNIVKQHIEYIRSRITLHELAKTQEQAQEQA